MLKKLCLIIFTALALLTFNYFFFDRSDDSIDITIYSRGDQYSYHAIRMIKLAAKKEKIKININVIKSNKDAVELRDALREGYIDMIWTATSEQLEEEFEPIKIPLYMGILGYRSCIVNSDRKELFKEVDSLEKLKKLKFAQGRGWSDIALLRQAGLDVSVFDHGEIFSLVDKEIIDCFPRAIFEAKQEQFVNRYKYYYKLHVDDNFIIHYELPFYFFMKKGSSKVFSIISNGLNKAISDGSYKNEIMKTKSLRYAIGELERNDSKVIISIGD